LPQHILDLYRLWKYKRDRSPVEIPSRKPVIQLRRREDWTCTALRRGGGQAETTEQPACGSEE
jgi:hypothetical protein